MFLLFLKHISLGNKKYVLLPYNLFITIEENVHIRGRDVIKPYIVPFVIATVIILMYLAIRYYKLNSLKDHFHLNITALVR